MSRIIEAVRADLPPRLAKGLVAAMADPNTPIEATAPATVVTPAVQSLAADAVEAVVKPIEAHLTNQEPWYQSRVTIGSLLAVTFPLLRALGVNLDFIDEKSVLDIIMSVIAAVGGLFALYGRWRAAKPLGE